MFAASFLQSWMEVNSLPLIENLCAHALRVSSTLEPILPWGGTLTLPDFENGKILPILCTWQDSAKHMKLAAVHDFDFGRRHHGTRGKHTETLKNGSRTRLWQNPANFLTLGILPSSWIWQPYKNLADAMLKLTLTCFSTCITLSLSLSFIYWASLPYPSKVC